MSEAAAHDAHGHHGSPFIQHHYDDAQHQFDSGKLGIWLFLAQEILFFSALFVAYIVYRAQHPEIYEYASGYLDVKLGALNTLILIGSSFTAAYAVRAAQLRQQTLLVLCLGITIVCALGFLTVKYFEYTHKGHIGTLYGAKFNPTEDPHGRALTPVPPAASEMNAADSTAATAGGEQIQAEAPPPNTNMFFTLYFAMTGLHGLHVLFGVFVFVWLFIRATKGHFTPEYYGPVDYAALYWHLVDLIWIFLFPLLYLI
jgi:cytochrome c oxidase subunit 3